MNWVKTLDDWIVKQTSFPDLTAINKLKASMSINTFDCDGVIQISPEIGGVHPGPFDVIITGRSFEEKPETERMLLKRRIFNKVFFNPLKFDEKTRESSGKHKAKTIQELKDRGYTIKCHFEDDPVQAAVIQAAHPDVKIVMLVHNFTELENVRHFDE